MAKKKKLKLMIAAGDSGVYAGWCSGADALQAEGRVVLWGARHLRRYKNNPNSVGLLGDGSVSDTASLGLAPDSPSISEAVAGATVLVGMRRLLEVAPNVVDTFGCPYPDDAALDDE